MNLTRQLRTTLALSLLAGAVALTLPGTPAEAASVSSAVTVTGAGEFSALKVTVSQTQNLVNQVVRLSWTGGSETAPTSGQFGSSYLQVMQCWGDEATGPKREQCQFGGNYSDSRGGNWTSTRQTSYGDTLVDPSETYRAVDGVHQSYVPFSAVNGTTTSAVPNEFFDQYSTNEVDYARTSSDGSGQEFFEVQTAREASGLGCGERLAGAKIRNCWLVVVPRGGTEVDGKQLLDTPYNQISSSPLSATNWAQRLVVPLGMQPLGLSCPIGSAERKIVGQESAEEAITRWQPALCATTSTIYGYSRVSDDLARGQLLSAQPGLALIGRPATSPSTVSESLSPVYAPVGLTGLVIALNIDQRSLYNAPEAVQRHDGQRVTSLRLNARLVAKMLTQSYRAATASTTLLPDNPLDLTRDKEFLALNPEFKQFFYGALTDITVPLGLSDATRTLWEWINGDADAHGFLTGTPDPYGAKVNPFYKGLDLPRDDYPKSDPTCATYADAPALCTLDAHAYGNDMHEGARGAARGDSLARGLYDRTATPPTYKRNPPALSGSRAVLAVTDRATAARYQLVTAQLQNAAGEFVAATDSSLLAGLAVMRPSTTAGVLLPAPTAKSAAAYPLTLLTYAATVPQLLDVTAGKQYAAFLRYAVGDGQVPGDDPGLLPAGQVPLPATLRSQALSAATAIETLAGEGIPTVGSPTPSASARPTATSLPTGLPTDTGTSSAGESGAPLALSPVTAPVLVAAVPTTAVPTAAVPTSTIALASVRTAVAPVGAGRFALAVLFVLGALALLAGPLLRRRRTSTPSI